MADARFQNFDNPVNVIASGKRLKAFRNQLAKQDLTGFLVPRSDEHQNEYVPRHAERLAWLTSFSGSAGLAVILADEAAIFVDGRYTLQVRDQVDLALLTPLQIPQNKPSDWIRDNGAKGLRLGYDPKLHTLNGLKSITKAVDDLDGELVPVDTNPVDAIWQDQPGPPLKRVQLHPEDLAGKSAKQKIKEVRKTLREAGEDVCVLTQPESVAWLLNIRGSDVSHNPIVLCYVILHAKTKPEMFVDGRKLTKAVRKALEETVFIRKSSELEGRLGALGAKKRRVRLDPSTASVWIADILKISGADISHGVDPCVLPKAVKTAAEITGSRAAHRRDGVALVKFLHWLDGTWRQGVDEIGAVEKLEQFRRQSGKLLDISFDTISGAGPNGAITHYRVSKETNRRLEEGTLYLVDSGGQYLDGTTDVTRTVALGLPGKEMQDRFTRVLRGHIAVATARFPEDTSGAQLDSFARLPLWEAGLDYDHGTGHGVGSYLSVHEGPQGISKRATQALKPGMILSNEPGYYKTGDYGIRIENLVLVTPPEDVEEGDRPMLGFETLTLAPIDRCLVLPHLLSDQELFWLNGYHARVFETLEPHLTKAERHWLGEACAPISP